ncbi:MAG TPA: aminotransferase class I/II-fold pyridoxal phosphate-dependent enzyme [Acidimicrobiia bacterium]|nr:aminotransferase class I/II-fold pyridoxal phosphate-dependent enzyme [Acidimicrobiia bacterium]
MRGQTRLRPGPHGGDGARLAAALGVSPDAVLDLSASLNPCAPDVAALVAAHVGAVRRYPDIEAPTEALAAAIGVPATRVVLTNGGAEAIALVAAELPVGWVDEPDFSLYARHLRVRDRRARRWRSNPHNPTGRLAAAGDSADIWDEAFYPLATATWTRGDPDAVVVGSLTKVFACPGLRVGYVLCPAPDLAERLRERQPRWSVNGLACAVLPTLLARADLAGWASAVTRLRRELGARLRTAGLEPEPSDAGFVLVRRAPGLRDHLARRGVLVRDTASFGLEGGVRIAVPDRSGLTRLEGALRGWAR